MQPIITSNKPNKFTLPGLFLGSWLNDIMATSVKINVKRNPAYISTSLTTDPMLVLVKILDRLSVICSCANWVWSLKDLRTFNRAYIFLLFLEVLLDPAVSLIIFPSPQVSLVVDLSVVLLDEPATTSLLIAFPPT